MATGLNGRVERLEARRVPEQPCPACGDEPFDYASTVEEMVELAGLPVEEQLARQVCWRCGSLPAVALVMSGLVNERVQYLDEEA